METQGTQKQLVNLQINGKSVSVPAGTTVFQAAAQAGIFIPHYCYHPDLSVAGVCRMCMVDIEKNPRLQISCNTMATEGMVVRTDNEKVKETVKSVLELHLINHPLDCPICDKAGECKLQDFYRNYGLYESRMEFDNKVHKQKAVDIGTIMLDSERCILCTRCVRFTGEVTKTNELGIFNRGDRSELRTFDRGPLNNEYTGNLADICPVGALTAKDFRFQCRVWFLEKTESVCTMCARGCNTQVSVNPKTKQLYRVEPRRNPEVNQSWICDKGRWDYQYVENERRVKTPRKRVDGRWLETPWNDFFRDANEILRGTPKAVTVAISTYASNEEVIDIVTTFRDQGVDRFTWIVNEEAVKERKAYDGLLKHRDSTPNALGFETVMSVLGVKSLSMTDAVRGLAKGGWLFCLGLEGEEMPGAASLLQKVPDGVKVVAHATSESPIFERIDWLLPNASSFEKNGTLINALGRLQRLKGSLPSQQTARDLHSVAFGVSRGSDRHPVAATRAYELFDAFIAAKILKRPEAKWKKLDPMGTGIEGN